MSSTMWTRYYISRIKEFAADEEANLTVEYVFMFPMLIWTYVAVFAFFDAFKAKNTNLTAAFTISDMLSRVVTNPGVDGIDMNYIDGLNSVFDFLTTSPDPTWIRVTSIKWDEDDNEYQVAWSKATSGNPTWTTATLTTVAGQIPIMSDGDYVILVETSMNYDPIFGIEMNPFTFTNFVVTSMRFAPKLCFTGEPCSV